MRMISTVDIKFNVTTQYLHCTVPPDISDAVPMLCQRRDSHGYYVAVKRIHD